LGIGGRAAAAVLARARGLRGTLVGLAMLPALALAADP